MASPEQKAPMEINSTVKRGREADPEPDTGRRQTKSQKLGKGRGKPSRRQEDNASSNSLPGDQEPKNLRKLVNLIAQLSLRQEDQLAIWRQDHSYVVFLRTDPQITVVPQLHQIGVKWQEKRSAAPASPGLPLRVVLLNCLLSALQTRVEELLQNPLKLKEAQERMLVTEDGNLNYMSYDVSNHKHQVEKAQTPIPLQQMVGHLRALQDLALLPRLIGRFHATRKLSESMQGENPPLHARGVSTGSCSPKGLRPLRHPLPPGSVAPCGRLSPPRTHSEDTSSAGRGAGYPLIALRLGNRSNYCYANSLVVLLMFVGSPSHAIFPAQLAALFNRLVASPGRHLWDDLIWRSLLAHWRRPSQQNDVAEFAYSHVGSPAIPPSLVNGRHGFM